jgi:hypothetical protein
VITIPPTTAPLEVLLQRVREHYREMPGLQLTKPQASRLFEVAPSVCAAMLRALVMENFLSRAEDGVFGRSTTYPKGEPRVALDRLGESSRGSKAGIRPKP